MARFPRWIEESGLPEQLSQEAGPEAWNVFRTLLQIESESNLIPGWASVAPEDLARWTGLGRDRVLATLDRLRRHGLIDLRDAAHVLSFRIRDPLPVPAAEPEIRERLARRVSAPPGMYLRYLTPLDGENRVQRVVHLYQCCFGVSFSPRIAEDLERIAIAYDMGTIVEVFEEAYRRGTKGLSWIKRRLAAGSEQT